METTKVYKSFDGRIFKTEEWCAAHERHKASYLLNHSPGANYQIQYPANGGYIFTVVLTETNIKYAKILWGETITDKMVGKKIVYCSVGQMKNTQYKFMEVRE